MESQLRSVAHAPREGDTAKKDEGNVDEEGIQEDEQEDVDGEEVDGEEGGEAEEGEEEEQGGGNEDGAEDAAEAHGTTDTNKGDMQSHIVQPQLSDFSCMDSLPALPTETLDTIPRLGSLALSAADSDDGNDLVPVAEGPVPAAEVISDPPELMHLETPVPATDGGHLAPSRTEQAQTPKSEEAPAPKTEAEAPPLKKEEAPKSPRPRWGHLANAADLEPEAADPMPLDTEPATKAAEPGGRWAHIANAADPATLATEPATKAVEPGGRWAHIANAADPVTKAADPLSDSVLKAIDPVPITTDGLLAAPEPDAAADIAERVMADGASYPDVSVEEPKRRAGGWKNIEQSGQAKRPVPGEPASAPSPPSSAGSLDSSTDALKQDLKAKSRTSSSLKRNKSAMSAATRSEGSLHQSEHASNRVASSAHWKEDVFVGKHLQLKVFIISGSDLRPDSWAGVVSSSCYCDLIGFGNLIPAYNSKWHSKTINDSRHPQWKDSHFYTEKEFMPGMRLRLLVHDKEHLERNGLLGSCILESREFYPNGFDGRVPLKAEGTPLGKDANIRLKIVVKSEEAAKAKAESAAASRATKQATKTKRTQLSQWDQTIKGISDGSSRVPPGQLLKPRGTPVYKRLHNDHARKLARVQEKIETLAQEEMTQARELLNEKLVRQGTQKETKGVIVRLYDDALQKRQRQQERVTKFEERLAEEMGPRNAQSYEDPEAILDQMFERLQAQKEATEAKLEEKRSNKEDAEYQYLADNSVHADCEVEDEDEVFSRLHGEHALKQEKMAGRQQAAEKRHAALHRVATLAIPKETKPGVRATIMSARNLDRPDGCKPELLCTCLIPAKAGLAHSHTVTTKPVRWKSNPYWHQEFDLSDFWDCKGPLTFTVLAEDFPVNSIIGRVEFHAANLSKTGFEGELKLKPPSFAEEERIIAQQLKSRFRSAGLLAGSASLSRFYKRVAHSSSREISFKDFVLAVRKDARITGDVLSDGMLKKVFAIVDADGGGAISPEEFKNWLTEDGPLTPHSTTRPAENQAVSPKSGCTDSNEELENSPGSSERVPSLQEQAARFPEPKLLQKWNEKSDPKEETIELQDGEGGQHMIAKGDIWEGVVWPDAQGYIMWTEGKKTKKTRPSDKKARPLGNYAMVERDEKGALSISLFEKEKNEMVEEQTMAVTEEEPVEPEIREEQAIAETTGEGHSSLLIKIQILPPKAQGRRAFIDSSVQRLHDAHMELKEKVARERDLQKRIALKQAKPTLKLSQWMPTVSADMLESYKRLHSDAHRRHADRRSMVKENLRKLKMAQDEDSVHSVAIKKKAWQTEDIDAVFDRVYSPPPKAFKIRLHKKEAESLPASPHMSDFFLDEAPIVTPNAWGGSPRRMGMFFNHGHVFSTDLATCGPEEEDRRGPQPSHHLPPRQRNM